MDRLSHVSLSFDNSRDTTLSFASAAHPIEPANDGVDGSLDEVSSRAPRDIWAEVTRPKLLLESREYTLVKISNQLLKMMDDLETKDHQLMLKD